MQDVGGSHALDTVEQETVTVTVEINRRISLPRNTSISNHNDLQET